MNRTTSSAALLIAIALVTRPGMPGARPDADARPDGANASTSLRGAPRTSPAPPASGAAPAKGAPPAKVAGPVNVNRADVKDLMTLDGVGRRVAERIVEYRKAHGPFKKPDDLRRVEGLSAAVLERNRERIVVK